MEQEKNNKGVNILLVVVIIVLLALVALLATGTINFKTDNSGTANKNINDETDITVNDDSTYKLGDVVKLSKIQNDSNTTDDYTEWYILEEKDGYTKLYSKNIWGGKNSLNDIGLTTVNVYNRLQEYGYNVTNVRQINEEELKLFSCNIDYKKLSNTIKGHENGEYSYIKLQNSEISCTNLPTFAYGYTDVQLFGYTLYLGEQMSLHIHDPNALVGFLDPVIVLPTSEIG